MQETWTVSEQDEETVLRIANGIGVLPVTARLLYNRGCRTEADATRFLRHDTDLLYDPYLMNDMKEAVACLEKALRAQSRITVYGDYDADGISATVLLYKFLKNAGADVDYYIPNREDGYGMHTEAIRKIAEEGTKLLITVDTGCTAIDEAELCAACGMELIVTDHHTCTEQLPRAAAVLNPHRQDNTYPFTELAGVGVAFKFICGYMLRGKLTGDEKKERLRTLVLDCAELLTLGTVADVVPLREENRLLVSVGLRLMANTQNMGLAALIKAVRAEKSSSKQKGAALSANFVSYFLAPRINAAGRMASASTAVELLLETDAVGAEIVANQLCLLNGLRQSEEEITLEQVEEQLRTVHDQSRERILVLWADTWHAGVIGIVASRLTERYRKPVILISFADTEADGDACGKGSGRSVAGFSLIDAVRACAEKLEGCGGHALACGLTVKRKNVEQFAKALNNYAEPRLPEGIPPHTMHAECELTLDEITLSAAQEIALLEPFGSGNPSPLFISRSVPITEIRPVGEGKHTRITIRHGAEHLCAMAFGKRTESLPYTAGDFVNLAYNLDVNDYNGRCSAQLLVRAFDFTDAEKTEYHNEMERYTAFRAAPSDTYRDLLPARRDFETLYRYLSEKTPLDCDACTLSRLFCMPAGLLMAALDIFCEAGLLTMSRQADDLHLETVNVSSGKKVTLSRTPTARYLCGLSQYTDTSAQ